MTLIGLEEDNLINKKVNINNKENSLRALDLGSKRPTLDILDTLANLSNDEVFTPLKTVNEMLDSLPSDIWQNSKTTFLDPACKSGIFLREIARRLYIGLAPEIPDPEKRRTHILHNQIYGLAITALTANMSRRTLYNSMLADSKYSLSAFEDADGNIKYLNLKEALKDESGTYHSYLPANNDNMEYHNYLFSTYKASHNAKTGHLSIHPELKKHINNLFGENMHFNVIIGNPPYQKGKSTIYHKFVENAIALKPDYVCMITPSLWLSGGSGLSSFRNAMLADRHIAKLVDYPNSKDCFPEVKITGGVSYFLWDKAHEYDASKTTVIVKSGDKIISEQVRDLNQYNTFIKDPIAAKIFERVKEQVERNSLGWVSEWVSSTNPFGIHTNESEVSDTKNKTYNVPTHMRNKTLKYIKVSKIKGSTEVSGKQWDRESLIPYYKVLLGEAYGEDNIKPEDKYRVIGTPFIAKPGEICSATYIIIHLAKSEKEAKNICEYINTRFFRFMLSLKKQSQHANKEKFAWVPKIDISKPWTEKQIYDYFGLTHEMITHIENTIRVAEDQ
jgi:site-specific DNA-methyltransferase (adenine-specific)